MKASWKRETLETSIEVFLDTDGEGRAEVETGVELLNWILAAVAAGAGFDLKVVARGDLETGDHHTTEDAGITLGSALAQALRKGLGSAIVPSGECLALAAVRFGRPEYRGDFQFQALEMGGMSLENFGHMMRSLAYHANMTLHLWAEGGNDASKIEALSTALGRALRNALRDQGDLEGAGSEPKDPSR